MTSTPLTIPAQRAPVEPRATQPPLRRRGPGALRTWAPLALILVVALAVRLVAFRSIWVDEAISIAQAQQPFAEMIGDLAHFDIHPPGYAALLWSVVHLTGSTNEFVVRLPSVLLSVGCVGLMYGFAHSLWDRRTALMAAAVFAIAPLAVWYGQEARMYSMWIFFALIALWSMTSILRAESGPGRWSAWLAFTAAIIALAYTQWFSALAVAVMQVLVLTKAIRRRRDQQTWDMAGRWLLSLITIAVAVAPLIPYLMLQSHGASAVGAQSSVPSQAGLGASTDSAASKPGVYAWLANLIWAVLGYHSDAQMVQFGALWPVLVLLTLGLLGRGGNAQVRNLLLVALVPAVLLFVVSFKMRMVFEVRYFTTLVPIILLLLARVLASWPRGPITKVLMPGLAVLALVAGLLDQQVNSSNPRTYDFKGAVQHIEDRRQPGDIVIYGPDYLKSELAYYDSGAPTYSTRQVDVDRAESGLPPVPAQGRRVFVLGSFLDDPSISSQVGTILAWLEHNRGATKTNEYDTANVTVWEFEEPAR